MASRQRPLPIVVLGLWWGDEGKGRTVDWLVSREERATGQLPLVVRFNGGAQAAHTVVRSDVRHVFGSFGSGGLLNAPTYLAEPFIVNPSAFLQEAAQLREAGFTPPVIVDPACRLQIPLDAHLCLTAEFSREQHPHGTCGYGINETVERDAVMPFRVRDLLAPDAEVLERLARARDWWRPERARQLGIKFDGGGLQDDANWLNKARWFMRRVEIRGEGILGSFPGRIIFEGAQGLHLSETNWRDFPHLTRSRTGLDNVIPLLKAGGFKEVIVIFVTRAYTTRHGPGPLPHEDPALAFPDATNQKCELRGRLRQGRLDTSAMFEAVDAEMDKLDAEGLDGTPELAVTCLDQASHFHVLHSGVKRKVAAQRMTTVLECTDIFEHVYESWGESGDFKTAGSPD